MRKHRIQLDQLKERSTANFKANELLGQDSCSTTEIHTHVSTRSFQNIVSAFDSL
ncbi:MAG: hypothetical protein IPH93_17640 [Saprospiraceae bacterium]|nr:hypothetical protein [Saprospiraceae bacterium]MBK7809759.1 hypothetical protein [Saprospiraceae bacterium]MBK9632130.1 hypothetical protein [Saprospiraceae bacterium]